MMKKTIILLAAAFAVVGLSGCAAAVQGPIVLDGNRDIAQVEVGYRYNCRQQIINSCFAQSRILDEVNTSLDQIHQLAARRCAAWGYKEANILVGATHSCRGEFCYEALGSVLYECDSK